MNKIKAIIFDMDGVLIDAKEWHYEALNKALGLFGFAISRYDHLVTYDGLPTARKLEMLSAERGLPRQLHPFINRLKQQYTIDYIQAACKPMFQHEYALSRLQAEGYRLAVASNSIRYTIEQMMEKSHLMPYLDFFLSNQDVKKAKPDPEIYTTAIDRFGLRPEDCLVVEDNHNGIAAAQAAGAHVLEVATVYDVTYDNIARRVKQIESTAANIERGVSA
ncbi:HAD family phosphatase [Agathobaculum sp. NTUH-O15-33]|uniref:HAD family hydrolase n=1 Tax=Agathobaculum sp. NTUH-O15-33 TaxID=3079302 RepID=UPI002958909A|nr:HAD family phosphatase [Agathobaculum sp. NTUH-O15-33]WNX85158.1 HAD family phosphatase [Agathobaculum sp. NTUH-O15-33]